MDIALYTVVRGIGCLEKGGWGWGLYSWLLEVTAEARAAGLLALNYRGS